MADNVPAAAVPPKHIVRVTVQPQIQALPPNKNPSGPGFTLGTILRIKTKIKIVFNAAILDNAVPN